MELRLAICPQRALGLRKALLYHWCPRTRIPYSEYEYFCTYMFSLVNSLSLGLQRKCPLFSLGGDFMRSVTVGSPSFCVSKWQRKVKAKSKCKRKQVPRGKWRATHRSSAKHSLLPFYSPENLGCLVNVLPSHSFAHAREFKI